MNRFISLNLIFLIYFFTMSSAFCGEGFFLFKKKQKTDPDSGYYGTLPKIEDDFKYKQQSIKTQSSDIKTDEKIEEEKLKPAPFDDALFLDIIVKKERTSTYINDIQKIKHSLYALKKCIEEKGDIQRFNGCVNLIDLYSKNLQTKYENKSESYRQSYINIINTTHSAKVIGNLLYDSNYYARYIPTQVGQYSDSSLESQKNELLNKINKTLFLINSEN